MSGTVKVKFIKDRGRRKEGDVVSYDDISAAYIVEEERAAEYIGNDLDVDTLPVFAEVVRPIDPSLPTVVFHDGDAATADAVSDDDEPSEMARPIEDPLVESDPKTARRKASRPVKSDES